MRQAGKVGCTVIGIHYHYPEDAYRKDPCPSPSLSQSIAKVLVDESEVHAYMAHPRLGGRPPKPSKRMDVGSICHALMLGKPLPEIEHIECDDYKKKDNQALRDLAIEAGKIPLNNKEWGEQGSIIRAAEILRNKLQSLGVTFDPDHCEVAMFWEVNGTQCKGKADNLEGFEVVDLKFTQCAHPDFIDRQVRDHGTAIQEAAYTEAVNLLVPEADGRAKFTLYFCEVQEPFCITPVRLSPEQSMIGQLQWSYAQRRWAECLRTNTWHEYMAPGECHVVQAKPWDLTQAIERYSASEEARNFLGGND